MNSISRNGQQAKPKNDKPNTYRHEVIDEYGDVVRVDIRTVPCDPAPPEDEPASDDGWGEQYDDDEDVDEDEDEDEDDDVDEQEKVPIHRSGPKFKSLPDGPTVFQFGKEWKHEQRCDDGERKGTWMMIPTMFGGTRHLSPSSLVLYLFYRQSCGEKEQNGTCWASIRKIAKLTGLSPKTITKARDELEEYGLIKVKQKAAGARWKAVQVKLVYEIDLDMWAEAWYRRQQGSDK